MQLIEDYESLAGRAADLDEALFELQVAIKHLLKDIIIDSATVSKEMGLSGVKLSKISVPIFDSKVFNWKNFWETFDATI